MIVATVVGPDGSFAWGEQGSCKPSIKLVSPSGVERDCSSLLYSEHASTVECVLERGPAITPIGDQSLMFPRVQLCTSAGTMVVVHPEPSQAKFDLALRVEATTPAVGSIA